MSRHARTLAAATLVTLAVPAIAQAHVSHRLVRRYERAYHRVAYRLGARAPGRDIVRYGLAGGSPATRARVRRSLHVLRRMLVPAATPAVVHHAVRYAARLDGDGDHDGDRTDAPQRAVRRRVRRVDGDGDHDGDRTDARPPRHVRHLRRVVRHSVARRTVRHAAAVRSGGGYVLPACIVQHESGGNPRAVASNGGGLYGILTSSWAAFGGSRYAPEPYDATSAEQGVVASRILRSQGYGAWSTAAGCGY